MSDVTWFVRREVDRHEIALPSVELRDRKLAQLKADGASDDEVAAARAERTAQVELRPLNAGHVAQLNELRLDSEGPSMRLGEAKVRAVELALVGWSLEHPITAETVAQLNPLVFEQIFELVDVGEGANGSGPPPPAAVEPPVEPTKDAADSS